MKSNLVKSIRTCGFVVAKKIRCIKLPKQSMEGLDFTNFLMEIAKNKKVLEFGSGGSTLAIASTCTSIVTVESEKTYIQLIKRALEYQSYKHVIQFFYANIGPVSSYGFPIKSFSRFFKRRYSNYYSGVFSSHPELIDVDIIFIDGRFRVACFIEVLINVKPPFTVIFDDFYRPEYLALYNLCTPTSRLGKSALFEVRGQLIPTNEMLTLLSHYSCDPR